MENQYKVGSWYIRTDRLIQDCNDNYHIWFKCSESSNRNLIAVHSITKDGKWKIDKISPSRGNDFKEVPYSEVEQYIPLEYRENVLEICELY